MVFRAENDLEMVGLQFVAVIYILESDHEKVEFHLLKYGDELGI